MTVNGVAPNSAQAQAQASAAASNASLGSLDKDAFLKLLVAQLKYQDPMNPADPTQFMAQTAQFTMVEKIEELSTKMDNALTAENGSLAAAMLGKTVSTNVDGKVVKGKVTLVDFDPTNGPILFLDGQTTGGIPFSAIQQVTDPTP